MTDSVRTRLKPLGILFFFLVTLALFTAFTNIGAPLFTKVYGIPVGIFFMVVSIVWHYLGSKRRIIYILSILFNSVGMGFLASSYYCVKGVPSGISDLAPALILPTALIFIACIILTFAPSIKHPLIVVLALLEVGLIIASIVFWCMRGGEFYAFSMFSLIIASFHTGVLAFAVDEEERTLLRDISFGSFGAFFIIGIVVIIVISQGEVCDGCDGCDSCDCGDCGCGSGKSKNKK